MSITIWKMNYESIGDLMGEDCHELLEDCCRDREPTQQLYINKESLKEMMGKAKTLAQKDLVDIFVDWFEKHPEDADGIDIDLS